MADPKPKRLPSAVLFAAGSPDTPVIEPIAEPEEVAAEPMETIAPVVAEPLPPVPLSPPAPVVVGAVVEDPWATLSETQAALTRGLEEFAAEMTDMTRSGASAGADAAIALLGARTLTEAVEINAGLVRRQIDAMIESSARLSEIYLKVFADASRPVLVRFGNV